MSWPCFLNLLHLIETYPIFYSQSQTVLKLKNIFQVIGYKTINLTLQESSKRRLLVFWMGKQSHLVISLPLMAITTLIERGGQVYSISLTLVCDVNKKFKSYLASYPGSCHDSY
ncbi:hypothetical protein VP01_6348g1, partial [Puccinia sorghi]